MSFQIGSSSRSPQSLSSLVMPQQSIASSLGLSSLSQSTDQVQVGVLSSLPQQGSQSSISQAMTQLSQISIVSQQSPMGGIGTQQVNRDQALPAQSRIPSVVQQQQNISVPTSMSNSLQQRPKPQRSKLPPPSKVMGFKYIVTVSCTSLAEDVHSVY